MELCVRQVGRESGFLTRTDKAGIDDLIRVFNNTMFIIIVPLETDKSFK